MPEPREWHQQGEALEAAASLEFQLITAASLAHNHRDEETHSSAGLGCGGGEIIMDMQEFGVS